MKPTAKFRGKTVVFCAAFFLGLAAPAFSDAPDIGDLRAAMDGFADGMARALPFNASMGLNWSDAHIGRFFPSLPPRFGVGISGGFTTMPVGPLGGLVDFFVPGLSENMSAFGGIGFPIPGVMLEGRIGGLFLPFDVGVKIGTLPTRPDAFESLDHFIVGADVRYALFQGRAALPTVSVGVGVNRLTGGVSRSLGQDFVIYHHRATDPSSVDEYLTVYSPSLGVEWATTTVDFRAQASWQILIVTPYLGVGASRGRSRVSYGLRNEGVGATVPEVKDALRDIGVNVDGENFSWEREVNGWNVRVFGGFSIRLPLRIRLDFTGMWDVMNNNYGATLGARLQI